MSRIGRQPVAIPSTVEVKIDGETVVIKGPRGELRRRIRPEVKIKVVDGKMVFERQSDSNTVRALHGLYRALIAGMVDGVTAGHQKVLELSGVGYRAAKAGTKLSLQLGFSHPVEIEPPPGIEFMVTDQDKITVRGADKELVGQVAAEIRRLRPVEPYKAKGVKYQGEIVRRKAGKAAKAAQAK